MFFAAFAKNRKFKKIKNGGVKLKTPPIFLLKKYVIELMTSKQVRSLGVDAMTVKFPCHRERKRGDPTEKVRGIYSALYSKGLPQSLRSLFNDKG